MAIKQLEFENLRELHDGIVLLGCSKPAEWVKGVSQLLHEQGIATSPKANELWELTGVLKTNGGRIDVVLVNRPDTIDYSKWAVWRINFGDASWISDYVRNYRIDHLGMSAIK
jgi:hypothetical protein